MVTLIPGITAKKARKLSKQYEDPEVSNLYEAEKVIHAASVAGFTNAWVQCDDIETALKIEKVLKKRDFKIHTNVSTFMIEVHW